MYHFVSVSLVVGKYIPEPLSPLHTLVPFAYPAQKVVDLAFN